MTGEQKAVLDALKKGGWLRRDYFKGDRVHVLDANNQPTTIPCSVSTLQALLDSNVIEVIKSGPDVPFGYGQKNLSDVYVLEEK